MRHCTVILVLTGWVSSIFLYWLAAMFLSSLSPRLWYSRARRYKQSCTRVISPRELRRIGWCNVHTYEGYNILHYLNLSFAFTTMSAPSKSLTLLCAIEKSKQI